MITIEISKHVKIKAYDGTTFYVNENHYNGEPDKSVFVMSRQRAWWAAAVVINKDGVIEKNRFGLEQLIDKALL